MTAASSPRARNRRKWIILSAVGLVLVTAAVLVLWVSATLGYSYSTGERAGYIQKLSHKGWLCKTYEGELSVQSLPGASPEIFDFSVRDKAVVDQINDLQGDKVVLTYDQHKGVPTQCFGETEYYVTGVRRVAK